MALKLFGIPMSTCAGRVLMCLHEKEADYELIPINMSVGEHKQPAFLAKNPFGQIPAFEDGDLTLFESRAITQYIAEKYKGSGYDLLRQSNPKEAALVKVWMEVETQQFNPVISPIFYEHIISPMMGGTTDQAVINSNCEKLKKVLDIYEARLSKTKYLAGDFFSLADLHHMSYIHYVMKTPCATVFTERPHVKAWWEDISSRPACKKVLANMSF